jgi:tetratricopeptide (TPR) repeat protein
MHRSGPVDFHRSREALEHLLERQPRMHSARPWLAKWFVLRTTRGMQPADQAEASRALDQTKRALDSRNDDAFALAIEGFIYFHLLRDAARAREKLATAVIINPNEPLASVFNAALVSAAGDYDGAWRLAERALALSPFDPLRPYMRMIAAACALSSERYEAAAELAQKSIHENAAHAAAWRTLVIALVQCQKIAEARIACARLMKVEPTLNLQAYASRLTLPETAKMRAIDALRIAGVPGH